MKKLLSSVSVAMLLAVAAMAFPAIPFAQAQTTTVSSTISAGLQAQLDLMASLTAQVRALQKQLLVIQQQRQTATAQLVSTLQLGSQGDQVKVLQALLAADPSIFPEGSITGFFGPATARAVKRFQKQNGISQVGSVGPKTLSKLNEWLNENPISLESASTSTITTSSTAMGNGGDNENNQGNQNGQGNNGENRNHPCAIVPPGHLIAPGWLRKHGGIAPIVPPCQTLPPGIVNHGDEGEDHHPTSTPTSTLPMVSLVMATAGTSTATISWSTNIPANSQVAYGLTSAYGSSTGLDTTLVTSHSQMLTGLTPSTLYHFEVVSMDGLNRTATSSDMTFTTNATTVIVTLPTISAVVATPATSTATVAWNTNAPANSQVMFGLTSAYGSSTALDASLANSHLQTLTGLTPSTTYHFQVKSVDGLSNATTSPDMTFTTNALPVVVVLPTISGISASAASTTANISWTTNVATNGTVFYSTVAPVNMTATSTLSIATTTLGTSHTLGLTGLTATTTYFYVIQSTDGSSHTVTSTQQQFTTTQ